MGKLLGFISCRDERIAKELARYLPDQLSLVYYLARAIRQNQGTLFTARQIGELLAEELPAHIVSWHDTKRLGVHTIPLLMKFVEREVKTFRPKALNKRAVLYARLLYRRKDLLTATSFKELEESKLPIPPGSTIEPENVRTFCNIYLCGLAMMVGVKIDPWCLENQSFSG